VRHRGCPPDAMRHLRFRVWFLLLGKKNNVKRIVLFAVLAIACLGCNSNSPTSVASRNDLYAEVDMQFMDLVSSGGTTEVVVRTQAQYDSLVYRRFTKPLQDYWNANYDTVLYYVRRNNPGLSDFAYTVLVREAFYQFPPFRGTENCSRPYIDFTHFTLLGFNTSAGGCSRPDYTILVARDDNKRELEFKILVLQHGGCEMEFAKNHWILVPRLPDAYHVVFTREYNRD